MPCILGFVRQMTDVRVRSGTQSETLTVSLIARRSRFRTGTRHWRRGIDGQGNVANFVESEQVVEAQNAGDVSAFVQLRGSIPACWSQVRIAMRTHIPRAHAAMLAMCAGRRTACILCMCSKVMSGFEWVVPHDYRKLAGAQFAV